MSAAEWSTESLKNLSSTGSASRASDGDDGTSRRSRCCGGATSAPRRQVFLTLLGVALHSCNESSLRRQQATRPGTDRK
ncbi:hypothetical protein MTO96_040598 [Rhipicephalus appendiculatus]